MLVVCNPVTIAGFEDIEDFDVLNLISADSGPSPTLLNAIIFALYSNPASFPVTDVNPDTVALVPVTFLTYVYPIPGIYTYTLYPVAPDTLFQAKDTASLVMLVVRNPVTCPGFALDDALFVTNLNSSESGPGFLLESIALIFK